MAIISNIPIFELSITKLSYCTHTLAYPSNCMDIGAAWRETSLGEEINPTLDICKTPRLAILVCKIKNIIKIRVISESLKMNAHQLNL